ncbi:HAD-IA family hydrolase [Vibrio japonicus]|uniref:HAD-IA family hydrolase n=1 Tax=Vibrio japonicus TaxID=1824638 RepID=A0ABY5LP17_9VIBR|nr:HAD-IA family hydrolase [Vibrio japonicus]UUM32527.1 HAD-IA family hydrolase [Vibrio japonicus]
MSNTQIKCVIFDCDGTIVDSEKLCCEALRQVFNKFGADLSVNDVAEHYEGGKLADILLRTQERLDLNISIDSLEPLYRESLDRLFEKELKPMDGIFDVLSRLKDQGVEYCVVSNSPIDKVKRTLELTGLLPYFEGKIFSAFDANSWKPEPDLILYSAMNMGFRVEECIYVDDTPKGLEAGVRAGIKTIHLLGLNEKTHSLDVQKIHSLHELELCI